MGKTLLVLLLATLTTALPNRAVADNGSGFFISGQAPFFTPPVLYGAELHPGEVFRPPSDMTAAPLLRERNEWEKRRIDQWSDLERHRQEWREAGSDSTVNTPSDTSATGTPASSTSF